MELKKKKSFGDIPNSSSIDILKPYVIFDYIGAFLRSGFAHVDNVIAVIKQWHGCSCQGCNATNHTGTLRNLLNPASGTYTNPRQNSPEPSGTFQDLPEPTFRNPPPEATPAYTGTLRNLPEPSGNLLPKPTPFYTGTLRNLPQPTSGTYTSIRRNHPEPSGTRLRNLHQHTPELSGSFRNLPPEPTPAHAGTLRNLPEPSSGTCSCGPHRHTPELIWAEDPISLRCWGRNMLSKQTHPSEKLGSGQRKVWVELPRAFRRGSRGSTCRQKEPAKHPYPEGWKLAWKLSKR